MPRINDPQAAFAVLDESTLTSALFDLGTTMRLAVYRDGRAGGNQYEPEERGLMIVKHGAGGYAVSAISNLVPVAAQDGVVSFLGDSEDLPDGETDNRTLLRFRFIEQG